MPNGVSFFLTGTPTQLFSVQLSVTVSKFDNVLAAMHTIKKNVYQVP